MRWRNDGGWTRQILCVPTPTPSVDRDGDAFDWRVSIAEVEADGPFSIFDGCDRVLLLLEGAGMDLRFLTTDETIHLRADSRLARFAGEVQIDATLIDGPTTDFNLIWRRAACDVAVVECGASTSRDLGGGTGEVVVAHVVSGTLALAHGRAAAAGDTVVGDSGEALHLRATGSAVVFVVTPSSRSSGSDQ